MRVALFTIIGFLVMTSAATAETFRLYAAGSLKAAMTDIAAAYEASTKGAHKVELVLGASGLLRERIEAGEIAHVFASADTGHPKRLEFSRQNDRPRRGVRAQPTLRAGARRRGRCIGDPARRDARSQDFGSARRHQRPIHPAITRSRCSARPTRFELAQR